MSGKKTDKKDLEKKLMVAVFTPYLYENMKEEGLDEEYIRKQIEKYGYDPENFHGKKFVRTESGRLIKLDTKDDCESEGPQDVLMAIHGATENAESDVRRLRGSGLIVARYSIFYGEPSEYTGRTPEESGYSLDVPKQVSAATALITDDKVIDALIEREAGKIREAVKGLNTRLDTPILVTPYLEKALAREMPKDIDGMDLLGALIQGIMGAANPDKYDPAKCSGCPSEDRCRAEYESQNGNKLQ